jgi:Mrp family chromosome partitioning ATPase
MSTTNEAFIKAYRMDTAGPATGWPAHWRQPAAACRTSVEFVSPDYVSRTAVSMFTPAVEPAISQEHRPLTPHIQRSTDKRPIGKRPLSAFMADRAEPAHHAAHQAAATFTPETTISAFRWPRVCRGLWEQYRHQYDRVADLLLAHCDERRSLVGVAGLRPGDGCTTTLLCLAMGLAAREARVIVVDANFRAPRLAHRLGVEPTTDWQEVLDRGVPVAEAVIRAANDCVDLLPLGDHTYHAEQLAAGLQPAVTAGVLRHAYDVALVDLGPILDDAAFAVTEPLIRNMRIDAAILVTDAHRGDATDLAMAGELLGQTGCELLGAIENRVAKTQSAGHG